MDDVILGKTESIERCIRRIKEEYTGFENELETNFLKQDSIILNLQRACELSIDLANYIVKIKKLGFPKESKESFEKLQAEGILTKELAQKMTKMVGFRNIAIHEYKKLDFQIVKNIVENQLSDFRTFAQIALSFANKK